MKLSGPVTEGEDPPRRARAPSRRSPHVAPRQSSAARAVRPLRRPPHRPDRGRAGQDARRRRLRLRRGPGCRRRPRRHQGDRGADPAGRGVRARGAGRAPRPRRPEHRDDADAGPRLLRDLHAARGPAQRHGEPGLVHGVHALPARDQPGPARGAAQLPDDGRRPDRPGAVRLQPARRGHRRGRGDDAVPPQQQGAPGRRVRRRRRRPPADRRRPDHPGAPARDPGAGGRPRAGPAGRRRLRRPAAVPGQLGRRPRPAPGHRGGPRARRPRRRRDRPAGPDAA